MRISGRSTRIVKKRTEGNTLPAHFDTGEGELTGGFDKDFVEELIGAMLFDLNNHLDDCLAKE